MADFSYTPQDPRAGKAINFEADARDPDGSIQSYEWSASDGAQGQGSSWSHSFADQASYTVTLTVTDNRDGTASTTKTVRVRQRYSEVTIEQVTVADFPFTNQSGEGWDSFSAPDPYVTAFNVTDQVVVEESDIFYQDVAENELPLLYQNTSFTIQELSKEYAINLWDDDTNADDFIGGISYRFDNLVGNYPNTFTLSSGDFAYEVELTWGN